MQRPVAAAVMGISLVTVLCATAPGDSDRAKVVSLHAQVITPASDALFQAESQPPATPEEWEKVAARAADLSRAAKELESMESAKCRQAWLEFAHALGAAAERAVRAAQARNLERASINYLETFPLFAALVLAAQVAGIHGALTEWGSFLYLGARVVYLPLYALGIPLVRSLVWNVAAAGMLLLVVALLRT